MILCNLELHYLQATKSNKIKFTSYNNGVTKIEIHDLNYIKIHDISWGSVYTKIKNNCLHGMLNNYKNMLVIVGEADTLNENIIKIHDNSYEADLCFICYNKSIVPDAPIIISGLCLVKT